MSFSLNSSGLATCFSSARVTDAPAATTASPANSDRIRLMLRISSWWGRCTAIDSRPGSRQQAAEGIEKQRQRKPRNTRNTRKNSQEEAASSPPARARQVLLFFVYFVVSSLLQGDSRSRSQVPFSRR